MTGKDSPEVQIAILQTELKNLTSQVAKLSDAVESLTAVMNRGKGAFAASLALAGVIGGGIIKLVDYISAILHANPNH